MCSFLALAGPLLSCYFLLRLFKPAGTSDKIIVFFCLFAAHIVALGYMLSFMNRLSDIRCWSMLGLGTALVSAVAAVCDSNTRQTMVPRFRSLHPSRVVASVATWYTHELSSFDRLLVTPLMLTCLSLGILNLAVVILTAPHNGDSMVCYLARVAYYLQRGNLNYFAANF
jgi:hypothetical protein